MGSYSGKVPFSQYAEAVFREVYEGAFKGDFFLRHHRDLG